MHADGGRLIYLALHQSCCCCCYRWGSVSDWLNFPGLQLFTKTGMMNNKLSRWLCLQPPLVFNEHAQWIDSQQEQNKAPHKLHCITNTSHQFTAFKQLDGMDMYGNLPCHSTHELEFQQNNHWLVTIWLLQGS